MYYGEMSDEERARIDQALADHRRSINWGRGINGVVDSPPPTEEENERAAAEIKQRKEIVAQINAEVEALCDELHAREAELAASFVPPPGRPKRREIEKARGEWMRSGTADLRARRDAAIDRLWDAQHPKQ